ncbi:MAG: protein kinase domain-containing protein [Pirellula sp.]
MASSDPDPLEDDSKSQPADFSGQSDEGSFIFPSSEPSRRPPSGEDPTVHASDSRPTHQPTSDPNLGYDESASLSYEGDQDIVIGRYRLLERIGRGTFGVVHRADDQMLKRHVALKLLTRFQNANEVAAWLDEARVLASLDHTAIVPVFDVGKSDRGQPFIVSKLIEGGSLNQRAAQESWSIQDSLRVVTQLAHALDYLHRRGTIHRDIKPSNILLTKEGDAILADFGLALPESGFGRGSRFVGTPAYMSPEQARHEGHRVDGRSDIYSLGVVFYELLTGKRPFQAADREELLDCIRNVEVRPPRQMNQAIPRELERICMKALSKKISDRYPTAADMAEELERWRNGDFSAGSVAGSRLAPVAVPDTLTTDRSLDLDTIAVVPHGLRSFDSKDSDFFRFLVAGVRDRDGIPESISFWTNRILSRSEDIAFRIGVLFGPSGSGKSSLIRAGVLPLVDTQVAVVYVDAKPEMLESMLARQIRQAVGSRTIEGSLPEMLIAVRESKGVASRKKLLLVIDQFEQWLNYHRQSSNSLLEEALRQCDGVNVQAILIVRDDFVLGVSSFMDELEVPLQQHRNFVTVEPFSDAHAKQVLTAFGRAYGAVGHPPTAAQTAFVDEAIRGLHANGRVDPLQIALLAEMTKGKPWIPSTLKQMGGIDGLGVAFLEERLTGPSANPFLRANELSVRRLLAELLPSDDATIKPPAILESELIERMRDCATDETVRKLLQTLDAELRLTTPTSNNRSVDQSNSAGSTSAEPAIQLAHDYLVATTRKWLSIYQTGTRRGRVREQLREITAAWKAKPTTKRLPTLFEWLSIHWFTRRTEWSLNESQLMQSANRRWLSMATIACLALFTIATITGWVSHTVRGQYLARSLSNIDTAELPGLLGEIEKHRQSVLHPLVGMPLTPPSEDPQRQLRIDLHTALANSHHSKDAATYAINHLSELEVSDLQGVIQHLAKSKAFNNQELATGIDNAIEERSENALPLVALLAARSSDHDQWSSIAKRALPILIREPLTRLLPWARLMRPAKSHFAAALLAEAKRRAESGDSMSESMITLVAPLASDDVQAMASAIALSPPDRIQPILRSIANSQEGANAIRSELQRQSEASVPPMAIPDALKSQLNGWGSVITRHGGWTEALPQSKLIDTLQAMRQAGYAPTSIRPVPSTSRNAKSTAEPKCLVAWKRSAQETQVLFSLDRDSLLSQFEQLSEAGWQAVDFSRCDGEANDATSRWIILFEKFEKTESRALPRKQSLHLEVPLAVLQSPEWDEKRNSWDLRRCITTLDPSGDTLHDVLFVEADEIISQPEEVGVDDDEAASQGDGLEWAGSSAPWILDSLLESGGGDRYPGYPIHDIRDLTTVALADRGGIWNDYRYYLDSIEENRTALKGRDGSAAPTGNNAAQLRKDLTLAFLNMLLRRTNGGQSEQALLAMDKFLEENQELGINVSASPVLRVRAIMLARLGRAEELEAIFPSIEESILADEDKALLRVRRAILAGKQEDILLTVQAIEALAPESSKNAIRLAENQIRALALLAGSDTNLPPDVARGAWDRLIRTATEYLSRSEADPDYLLDCDFDRIRESLPWRAFLEEHQLSHRITTVYNIDPSVESRLLFQMSPAEHRRAALALMAEGFHPRAMEWHAGFQNEASDKALALDRPTKLERLSSVWHRTPRPAVQLARQANSIASLALALAAIGQTDALSQAFEDDYGRGVQTAVIAAATKIIPAKELVKILQTTQSNALQCSLISALAEIPWSELDPSTQNYLQSRIPTIAHSAENQYLASMAQWACRRWQLPLESDPVEATKSRSSKLSPPQRITNAIQQEMIRIDGPEFVLEKLDLIQQQRADRETHIDTNRLMRRVWCKLDRSYRISSTEVTGAQFQQFLDDTTVKDWIRKNYQEEISASAKNLPQAKVSWHVAIRFCQWLNVQDSVPSDQWCYEDVWTDDPDDCHPAPNYLERSGYRLPTFAEWIWACRAGSEEQFHFGSDAQRIGLFEWTLPHSNDMAHPVGRLRPNAFGLFDMGGNLAEWTDSQYRGAKRGQRFYIVDSGNDPNLQFDKSKFILCGGRFRFVPKSAISDSKVVDPADYQTATTGFRVAQTVLKN